MAGENEDLRRAAAAYGRVASHLRPVWECFSETREPGDEVLASLAESIKQAKAAEEEAIEEIKCYLARSVQ